MAKKCKGTHWVSLFIDRNTAIYFDSLEIEFIPQEVLNKIREINQLHTIYLEYKIMNLLYVDFILFYFICDYFKDKYDRRSKS